MNGIREAEDNKMRSRSKRPVQKWKEKAGCRIWCGFGAIWARYTALPWTLRGQVNMNRLTDGQVIIDHSIHMMTGKFSSLSQDPSWMTADRSVFCEFHKIPKGFCSANHHASCFSDCQSTNKWQVNYYTVSQQILFSPGEFPLVFTFAFDFSWLGDWSINAKTMMFRPDFKSFEVVEI